MSDDMDFFQGEVSPADAPVAGNEDGGFTLLGEAGAPADDMAAFVGDVQDTTDGDLGFAAVPDDLGFAAAPDDIPIDDSAPIILAPPAIVDDNAPIVLGAPPVIEDVLEPEEPATPEEPSAMKKFNEEWQETLANCKAEEDAAMVQAARVGMEEFQTKAQMKRDAKMAKNREDEQAKLEAIEADLENDNSWQRVSKMVDLTQDGAEDAESTKRMRDIFIQLKNEQGLAAKVGAWTLEGATVPMHLLLSSSSPSLSSSLYKTTLTTNDNNNNVDVDVGVKINAHQLPFVVSNKQDNINPRACDDWIVL